MVKEVFLRVFKSFLEGSTSAPQYLIELEFESSIKGQESFKADLLNYGPNNGKCLKYGVFVLNVKGGVFENGLRVRCSPAAWRKVSGAKSTLNTNVEFGVDCRFGRKTIPGKAIIRKRNSDKLAA